MTIFWLILWSAVWLVSAVAAHGFMHAYQMRDEPYPRSHNWQHYNNQDAYRLWAMSVIFCFVFGPLALIAVLAGGGWSNGFLLTPRDK